MIRPQLRLGGPLDARDATWLLTPATLLVAARFPMGFLALLALPAAVVVVQGVRRHAPWPAMLRQLCLVALACSFVALALNSPLQLASPQGSFLVMVAITLCATAVFAGNRPLAAAHRLVDGIHLGLLLSWAISIMEAVTGFKMMTVLYPGANTVRAVAANRFYVSALFPNYNDYSVAMVYLCLLTFAGIMFHARVPLWRRVGRVVVLLSATFFIVSMGSRGSLAALVLGLGLMSLVSVRQLHPRAIGPRLVFLSLALGAVALAALLTSSYVNDHSTASRGRIADAITGMALGEPAKGLLGWGSYVNYSKDAASRYGALLMDPHNVLLEIVIWFGLPTLLLYLACWWFVVRRGLLRPSRPWTWRSAAVICIASLMPLIGIVCSSTLRYHLFWLWLIAALAELQQWQRDAQQPASRTSSSISPV